MSTATANRVAYTGTGADLTIQTLAALLGGFEVIVTVADHPNQIQNGPNYHAGTVESVFVRDPNGRNSHAGSGSITFRGGMSASWTRHHSVTIEVRP